jgi:hypothetical protein
MTFEIGSLWFVRNGCYNIAAFGVSVVDCGRERYALLDEIFPAVILDTCGPKIKLVAKDGRIVDVYVSMMNDCCLKG